MGFDYYYVEESESYIFYRIPKILITDERFETLSTDAKVLYGLLLDRIGLSREHGWVDEEGHVYVYYSMESIMKALRRGKNKACRLLRELEDFGLIERRKQGLCKPAQIFLKKCSHSPKEGLRSNPNGDTGLPEKVTQESPKQGTNNNEYINTEDSKTYPILSGEIVDNLKNGSDKDADERAAYSDFLYEQLRMDILYDEFPYDREILDEIMELILDVVCSKRKTIRIAGDDKPVEVVRSKFLKLEYMHIAYVLDCMKNDNAKVRNIKQYLLAAIYNAPLTMHSFYQSKVNFDTANGKF
ncbi:MAG: replication initiator protein A [Lachnospiraceae bacterium]|nr:replication initiator protein A [Lachnospiraceae bacterium]